MGLLMSIRDGDPVSEDFQPIDLVIRASTPGGLRTVRAAS